MAVVLGLLVSVFYGSGDFMGGLASKRTRTSAVVVGSFVTSTAVLLVITATVAATVPFAWGIASGERPPALAIVGVVVALIAVGLVSGAPSLDEKAPTPADLPRDLVGLSVLSGAGFGTVYVLLGSIDDGGNLWPLVTARTTALVVTTLAVSLWALRRRDDLRVVLLAPVGTGVRPASTLEIRGRTFVPLRMPIGAGRPGPRWTCPSGDHSADNGG